jgi:predicted nucleic acid-binding protein
MGRAPQTSLVVLDNTVLTNFALVKRPDLILGLWETAASITPDVLDEYRVGEQAVGLPSGLWDSLPVLSLTQAELALALSLSHRLGKGERSCLAAAVSRGALLATDDLVARQHAKRAGLTVIGSVGILIRNIQQNRLALAEAQGLLDEMIAAGYHSPTKRLDTFMNSGLARE